jgi:uncharacterized protein
VAHLSDNKHSLLAHGITGALDKVSRSIGDLLVRERGNLAPLDEIDDETASALRARGHLTELSLEDELKRVCDISSQLRARGLQNKIPSVSFVPTYQCNLRCFYCFQPHKAHAGHGKFSAIITPGQIDAAFEIIDKFSHRGALASEVGLALGFDEQAYVDSNHTHVREIGLFGGEPLTQSTLSSIEHIALLAKERSATLWGITNGVELHHFEHLLGTGPGKISELQITIDGIEEHHNARRKGPRLHKTFTGIIENIELALAKHVQINIRMNTDRQNADDIESLAKLFQDRGWQQRKNFSFGCAVVTSPTAPPQPSWSELVSRTSEATLKGFEVQSYEHFARDFLMSCFKATSGELIHRKTANCAAEEGQLMFDCMGDVYGCWEDVGFDQHKIGSYDSNGLYLDKGNVRTWFGRHPGMLDECISCPYALIHTSGCAAQAREHQGSILKNDCAGFQSYFPQSLAKTYEHFEYLVLNETNAEVENV